MSPFLNLTTRLPFALAAMIGLCHCQDEGIATNKPSAEAVDLAIAVTPSDVKPTCTVTPTDFAKWFESGEVTVNGKVNPANSLVALATAGDFYKWSWQMFLWQTSPNQSGYVFNTAPFYDVDASGTLVSHDVSKSGSRNSLKRVSGVKSALDEDVDGNGQAGILHGVLMTQNVGITPQGSLVYYALHVNDVYAYMASGINSGEITDLHEFPTTASQLKTIKDYAQSTYGMTLTDDQALTLELKSSWVKADAEMDLSGYLTIEADVPQYTQPNDQKWSWDGSTMERGVTLACIGYHLVGPSKDHPEMIWATFEHSANAPSADYYYIDTNDEPKQTSLWNSDGTPTQVDTLLMSNSGTQQGTDQMFMEMDGNDIVATPGHTISASDSSRTHPWGGVSKVSSAENNTDIISLNQSIQGQLATGDPRANYFLVGATWTANGVPGVGLQEPVIEGSLTLANSTMETYYQFKNCLDCHQGSSEPNGKIIGLSHIFETITPLAKPIVVE